MRILISGFIAAVLLIPSASFAMAPSDLYLAYAVAQNASATGALDVSSPVLDVDLDADADTSVDMGGDSSTSVDSNATVDVGEEFTFDRKSMTADTSVQSTSMVENRADLEAYVSTAMEGDERFAKADFGQDHVTVWYTHPTKVLGMIPVDMQIKATVDAAGTVDISYPWYSFMASTSDKAELEAAVENQMKTTIAASTDVSATSEASPVFSSRMQAEIMADLVTALRAGIQ